MTGKSADEHIFDLLTEGTRFDTTSEEGCVVTTSPADHAHPDPGTPGAFMALDSEGVECEFIVAQVTNVW